MDESNLLTQPNPLANLKWKCDCGKVYSFEDRRPTQVCRSCGAVYPRTRSTDSAGVSQ